MALQKHCFYSFTLGDCVILHK